MSKETRQTHEILFDQNPDAVFSFDLNGNFVSANKVFLTLGECTIEEALNGNFVSFLPPHEVERVTDHFKKAVAGEIQRYETDTVTAKGNTLTISVTNFPIVINGEITGVYGIARDITELKRNERALQQSEDKYRSIIENALSAFLLTIPDSQLIDANKAALDMFGYTLEEFKHLPRKAIVDHDDPRFIQFLEARKQYGYGKGEFIGIRKNGERFPCEYSSVVFNDISGHLRRSINIIDISERKAAEKNLHHQQELLNAIINNADEGIAVTDLNGHFLVFNQAMVDLLGVQKTDSENYDWSTIFNIHYPDSRQPVPRRELPIVRTMRGEAIKNQVFLIKNPIRGDVYMSVSSSPIRDALGNIVASMVIDRDITQQVRHENELKNAIEQLKQSNLRFANAAKATSDAIWDWDLVNDELYWGDGFETLFGYELSKIEPVAGSRLVHIHPDDRKRVLDGIRNALDDTTQNSWSDDFLYIRADNTYALVSDKGIIIRNDNGKAVRMIGAMQDVTRQKTFESALVESNERFTYAAQATSEAIWEWNIQTPEIFKEYGYKDLFGYEFTNNIGEVGFWASKVHPEDHPRIWPQMLSTREDPTLNKWTIEYRFRKANDEYIFIKEKAILLRNGKGDLLRMIGSMQDVTRQKIEEAELKLLAEDLYKRNNELQQFGYVVSHNLRSPVANIMGITTLLELDKDDPETVEQCTRDIKNAIHRLDDVIRDLSKILSITDGSAEIIKDEIDLAEILTNVTTDLKETIAYSGAVIQLPSASMVLFSHKAYLYSIFYNLVSNAIKYRSAAAPQIRISVATIPGSVIITISDNGVGIDLKKHSGDIFKPYKRFNTGIEGKGLGLFLVKSHVEALKGKIEIGSKPGKGTTFTITLPMSEARDK